MAKWQDSLAWLQYTCWYEISSSGFVKSVLLQLPKIQKLLGLCPRPQWAFSAPPWIDMGAGLGLTWGPGAWTDMGAGFGLTWGPGAWIDMGPRGLD